MSNLIIFHARCLDGTVAAAVAYDALHGKAELWPASYTDTVYPEVAHKNVYIVDFSYPRDVLMRMHDEAHKLVVLDHHKTAAEALTGLDYAVFDMQRSGAGLAWDYFHPDGEGYPAVVQYVQDRDLWRFEFNDTRAFCAALQYTFDGLATADDQVFTAQLLLQMDGADVTGMIDQGRLLVEQNQRTVENICEQHYLIQLLGQPMRAVNAPGRFASEAGNYLAKLGGPDGAACVWYSDGQNIRCMLRSQGATDVSAIAKVLGGGGHQHAAGFTAALTFLREVAVAQHVGELPAEANETGIRVWNVDEPAPADTRDKP
jgi:uncharacterized protein